MYLKLTIHQNQIHLLHSSCVEVNHSVKGQKVYNWSVYSADITFVMITITTLRIVIKSPLAEVVARNFGRINEDPY
jgi:hypothetical protein